LAITDATTQLEDLGWAETGGGYQVPECMPQLQLVNAALILSKQIMTHIQMSSSQKRMYSKHSGLGTCRGILMGHYSILG